MKTAFPVLSLMVATELLSGCVVVTDCTSDTCGSSDFHAVINDSFGALRVEPGPYPQLLADCGDGTNRILDVTTFDGILRVDSDIYSHPALDRGCILVAQGPRFTFVENRTVGELEVMAGTRAAEIRNLGSGTVRVRGVTHDDLLVTNASVGSIRVDEAEGEQLRFHNDGSGTLRVDLISAGLVEAVNTSVGDVMLESVDAWDLVLSNSGSGVVMADGAVDAVAVDLHSVGDVDVYALANAAWVTSTGSGDAWIYASEFADVTIDSVGDVYVSGRPAELFVRGYGSGDVILQ